MDKIRNRALAELKRGDSFVVSRTFTEQETVTFAELTRDYNPVHCDPRFAAAKNFRDRICHGLLVASLLTEIGGQLGWLATGMQFRFKKPVYFGDTIECRLTITEIDDRNRATAEAVFTNQQGEIVLKGSLTGHLPGALEKRIMEDILAEGESS